MTVMENSYWNGKGTYQALTEVLSKLVPDTGSVVNSSKNRALERYRKACNYYYDLYNNGLYNRAAGFSKMFGVLPSENRIRTRYGFDYTKGFFEAVEKKMDIIIMEAAKEQNVPK